MYLRVIGDVKEAEKDDLCQVYAPNWPEKENNTGFLIQNIENGNYYQVVTEITDYHKKIIEDFDFFIITWNDFFKYFRILKEDEF